VLQQTRLLVAVLFGGDGPSGLAPVAVFRSIVRDRGRQSRWLRVGSRQCGVARIDWRRVWRDEAAGCRDVRRRSR